jgi:uncharacterized membrane protein
MESIDSYFKIVKNRDWLTFFSAQVQFAAFLCENLLVFMKMRDNVMEYWIRTYWNGYLHKISAAIFSIVLLIFVSINTKNLTFQALFVLVAYFTVAFWLILTPNHGNIIFERPLLKKKCMKPVKPNVLNLFAGFFQ